jgi:hypothetical protein
MYDREWAARVSGPKTFLCGFNGVSETTLLDFAAYCMSQVPDRRTGAMMWSFERQMVRDTPSICHISAHFNYPIAGMNQTVGLRLEARKEDDLGGCLILTFADSMGWEAPTSEWNVDATMLTLDAEVATRFNKANEWRIVQGEWRHDHRFVSAVDLIPKQSSPATDSDDSSEPDDLYVNPATARKYCSTLRGAEARTTIGVVGEALATAFVVEYADGEVAGVSAPTLEAKSRLVPSLSIVAAANQEPGQVVLTIIFADTGRFAAPDASHAVQDAISIVNKTLAANFPGENLKPLS